MRLNSMLIRILAIVQLCFAFSLLLWDISQQFLGEYFKIHSRLLVYEYVISNPLFEHVSTDQKNEIINDYKTLLSYSQRPTLEKIREGLEKLAVKTPVFEQAWIFFSIIIAVLILLKVEGALESTITIFLITIGYCVVNYCFGHEEPTSLEEMLIPKEEFIIKNYITEDAKTIITKNLLEEGWKQYLIEKWSKTGQVEEGEFYFTLARLNLIRREALSSWLDFYNKKQSIPILFIYLCWNTFFSVVCIQNCFSNQLKLPLKA